MNSSSPIQSIPPSSSLRAEVERALSTAIISGELVPGTVVSVPGLASQFGVSATPVREAMLDLEKRGFVESVRNKGFRITTVGEDDLREIVQVRRWLEIPAIRIAAEVFPADRLPEFRGMAEQIIRSAATADFAGYLAADSRFHLALIALTGNPRLVELVAELRSQTRMVGLAELRDTRELEESANEHHMLLDLLVTGNADAAGALMHAHIGHVLGWWAGRAEDQNPTPDEMSTRP
ncbi:GntR family transcriptional regulator [Subtercola boreus]|uniref:GntR family transcriptional regulator n=1 Tax=Subtercola boreus TaxID=120213 RepID=A0A3E0WAP0_9MICO|nr:GntR family transcriptional regulator [Subtercola boreus]RFA19838.1 GntR family transcriptional regulator [Subtercola boreus]RFA19905.1 GntR family transcriptional regulator [Subtercola boreus]RFA26298.1 GntR family transcriptional regulator [Subtercola boreus]